MARTLHGERRGQEKTMIVWLYLAAYMAPNTPNPKLVEGWQTPEMWPIDGERAGLEESTHNGQVMCGEGRSGPE